MLKADQPVLLLAIDRMLPGSNRYAILISEQRPHKGAVVFTNWFHLPVKELCMRVGAQAKGALITLVGLTGVETTPSDQNGDFVFDN